MREHREGVAHFETQVRKQLEPFKKAITWKHEVHPAIVVPLYVPARRITAVMAGSHGRTVNPADAARRQVFPFYQMVAKHVEGQFSRYALVSPDYWKLPDVKQLIKDVNPEVVQTNQLQRFEKAIRGNENMGLVGAAYLTRACVALAFAPAASKCPTKRRRPQPRRSHPGASVDCPSR